MAAASAFKIKCPSCEAMVMIRDSNLIGKKVDCPKCKFRFVIEAPAESSEADVAADSAKQNSVGTAAKEKTKAGDAASKAGMKKMPPKPAETEGEGEKKTAKSKSTMTLIVGGGIGVLAILVLVVYFMFFGDDSPTPKPAGGTKGITAGKTNPEQKKNLETVKAGDPKAGKTDPGQPAKVTPVIEQPVDPVTADITNLLPEDSQLVMRVDGKQFLDTPIGGVFFDDASESAPAFQRWMGFGGGDVERFACAVTQEGAFFGVVRLNKNLKLDELKLAMELDPTPKIIKNRELWTIKSNELFTMLGDYLAHKIKDYRLPLPKPAGSRTFALALIDPKTLVFGDQLALDRFLEANLKRKFQMVYVPADAPAPVAPKAEEKKTDPKGAKKAKMAEPKPDEANAPGSSTTNPSFLSVDPGLKIMINQLDTERNCVLALAVKIPDSDQPGANLFKQYGKGYGLDVVSLPKTPVVGLAVRQMDDSKLNAAAAIEYPLAADVLAYAQNLQIAAQLAIALTAVFKVPIRSTTGDPNAKDMVTPVIPPPKTGKRPKKNDPNMINPDEPPPPATSTVSLGASDRYLVITLDIDWKPVYSQQISNSIRSKIDLLKGEALMMAGQAFWHSLPVAINRIEKSGTIPFAAYPRPVDASRFGVPYRPEQRVSWMVEMLPYLGYEGLSRKIKRDRAWNYENPAEGESNLLAGSAWIPEFLSHDSPNWAWRAHVSDGAGHDVDLGATNFVGITGVGMDAGNYPDTPEYAKRLGLFGNDRQTKIADVVAADGLSNTIFMIEVPPTIQRPWIRGGGATAQGVPETGSIKPFVSATKNGKRGTYVLMADGSIRFISETIDDEVFKALATYKGGEKIDNIDQIASPEKVEAKLTMPGPMPKKDETPKK
jgi:hypothetical protein